MDEQRLVRALRAGPRFATAYTPVPLSLEPAGRVRGESAARLALLLTTVALLLAATLIGLLVSGLFRATPASFAFVEGDAGCGNTVSIPMSTGWSMHLPGCDHLVANGADGDERIVLPDEGVKPVSITKLSWSASGDRLAFVATTREGDALYTVAGDGSDLQVLYRGDERLAVGPWSPDERTIVVYGWDRGLLAVDTRTGEQTALFGDASFAVGPGPDSMGWVYALWSPDSARVAFWDEHRDEDGTPVAPYELLVARRDGSERRQLDTDASGGMTSYLAWSPDAGWIAYLKDGGLWVARPDGTERRELLAYTADTHGRYAATPIVWSPDSRSVFIEGSNAESGHAEILDLDLEGGITVIRPRLAWEVWGIRLLGLSSDRDLIWVAEGSQTTALAITSLADHGSELLADVSLNFSDLGLLDGDPARDVRWSPDRNRLTWLAPSRRTEEVDGACLFTFDISTRTTTSECRPARADIYDEQWLFAPGEPTQMTIRF